MKICPLGAVPIHGDRHDEATERFPPFMQTHLKLCTHTQTEQSALQQLAALSMPDTYM
jgi:hypothetical protein